jgi:hypothetical protein
MNRHQFIRIAGTATTVPFAGCIRFGYNEPADSGTIHIYDYDGAWASGKNLRIIARKDDKTTLEENYELPVEDPELVVPATTYQIEVYLDQIRRISYEWEINNCNAKLYVEILEREENGVRIDTSNC